jgi:hypothetical protein
MAQGPAIQRPTALESDGNLELLLKAVLDLTNVIILLNAQIEELKVLIQIKFD